MEIWQEEVHEEKQELSTRIELLEDFIRKTTKGSNKLLKEQLGVMKKYEAVLVQRIAEFK